MKFWKLLAALLLAMAMLTPAQASVKEVGLVTGEVMAITPLEGGWKTLILKTSQDSVLTLAAADNLLAEIQIGDTVSVQFETGRLNGVAGRVNKVELNNRKNSNTGLALIVCFPGIVASLESDSTFIFKASGQSALQVKTPPALRGVLAWCDTVEVEFNVWPTAPGRVCLLRTISGPTSQDADICDITVKGIGVVKIINVGNVWFSRQVGNLPVRLWQPPKGYDPGIRLVGEMRR